jgi:hypothetical protein
MMWRHIETFQKFVGAPLRIQSQNTRKWRCTGTRTRYWICSPRLFFACKNDLLKTNYKYEYYWSTSTWMKFSTFYKMLITNWKSTAIISRQLQKYVFPNIYFSNTRCSSSFVLCNPLSVANFCFPIALLAIVL